MVLKDYLRKLREEKKITQEELAAELEIEVNKIKKWEKGTIYPELEEMYKISEIYQVPCKELLDYKEREMAHNKNIIVIISRMLGISTYATAFIVIVLIAFFFCVAISFMATAASGKALDRFYY